MDSLTSQRSLHRIRDNSLEKFDLYKGDEVMIDGGIAPTTGCIIAVKLHNKRAIGKYRENWFGKKVVQLPHCQEDWDRCQYLGIVMKLLSLLPLACLT